MRKKTANHLIVFLVLMIFASVSIFAATEQETASSFLILSVPESADEPEIYKSFFIDAISIELATAGVLIISSDIGLNAGINVDDSAVFSIANEHKADFVLVCVYGSEERRIRLKFLCYDVKNMQIISEIEEEVPLDLAIDQTIAKSIKQVLRTAQAQIVLVPAEEEAETTEHPTEDSADSAEVVLGTELEAPSQIEEEIITGTSTELPAPPISSGDDPSTEIQEPPDRIKRFSVSFGYSPFVPIGKSSGYIENAQMPALTTGLNFYVSSLLIRTGIYSALCWFQAAGSLAESDNMLIPAGVHIDLTGSGIEVISFLLRLSGGPAFFGINVDDTGYQFKVLPYALGTIGISAAIGESYGLSLELSFSAFFEPDYPIMGYMPGIRFYING
jgi:hypothetical protein